jgi:molybdopterin-guanine dinucleotide biosynthesis protein A
MSVRAIILAAGKGTRMRSETPKVLHPVAGRPIVSWVIDAVRAAGVDDVTVVIGHGADSVAEVLPDGVRAVVQSNQNGTGDAARVAIGAMGDLTGDVVLVVPGDSPLFRPDTLRGLLAAHAAGQAACTVLCADDRPDRLRTGGAGGGGFSGSWRSDADQGPGDRRVAVSTYVRRPRPGLLEGLMPTLSGGYCLTDNSKPLPDSESAPWSGGPRRGAEVNSQPSRRRAAMRPGSTATGWPPGCGCSPCRVCSRPA